MSAKELIFIYNANSGIFSGLADFAHKLWSPATYPCQLCALTYGNAGMKNEWRAFLADLKLKKTFLYKDEIVKYGLADFGDLPLVLLKDKDGMITRLFDSSELAAMESLHGFVGQLKTKLELI